MKIGVLASRIRVEEKMLFAALDARGLNWDLIDDRTVIFELGKGLYAFYAHLKKGSVRVKVGDRVRAGQQLAHLGNTGNTSAPHLHLHIMSTRSALGGDGLPYVFRSFTLAGMLDPEQWYDPDSKLDAAYRIVPGDGRGPRRDELPLDLRIVGFPAAH